MPNTPARALSLAPAAALALSLAAPPAGAQRRADPDSLVVWDSARVVDVPQLAAGHTSGTASCVGSGGERSCGDAYTLLLDDHVVNLQGAGATAASRLATAELPFTLRVPARRLRLTHDLRFHVEKSAAARVALVVDVGGRASVIEFPRGRAVHGDQERVIERAFPTAACPRPGGPTCHRVERIALLLLAERDGPDAVAMLAVDADDIRVASVRRAGTGSR